MESTESQEQRQDYDTSIASASPIVKAASEPVIIRVSPTTYGSLLMDSSDNDIQFTFKVSGMRLANVPSGTTTCVPHSNEYDETLSDTSSTLVEIDEKSFQHQRNTIQQLNLSRSSSSSSEYRSNTCLHPVLVRADVHSIPRVSLNRPENIPLINNDQPVSVTVPSRTLEERNLIRENDVPVTRAKKDISVSASTIVSITNPSNQGYPIDRPLLKNDSDATSSTSYKSTKPHTVKFHTSSNRRLSVESENSEYINNNFLLRNATYSDNLSIVLSMDATKIPVPETRKLTFVLTRIKRTNDTLTYISDQSIKCQICQKDMTLIFYFFATGILRIYDKPKKAIHPYEEKKGTIRMAHNECLGAQLNDDKCRNYILKLSQRRAPILQWWRKKKQMINIIETINLMMFCLMISCAMSYVFYTNYSSELTIIQKTMTVILIFICVLLIGWRSIYLVCIFRKNWKKLCKSNQIVEVIIWKCDISKGILEEETCL